MTRITSLALALAGLMAVPAVSDAATTFGSRLNHDPANSGECMSFMGPCTIASYIHPSDPDGDPYAGGAPVDGVITKFRIRGFGEGGAAATVTFRLASVTPDAPNSPSALGQAGGTGPTVTIPAMPEDALETPITEFPASVPVKQGQHIAIDGTNVWATYNSNGSKFSYVYSPTLVDGEGPRGSSESTGELLVNADIEPDADSDGLGDETQDQNVGPATAADTTKPRLRGVKLSRKAVSYRLSEAAEVTIKVKKGRRTVRTLSDDGTAGKNKVKLGRRLGLGRYRVVVEASDAAGNESARRIKRRLK